MAEQEQEWWRAKIELTLDSLRHDLDAIESELAVTRALRANGGDDDEHDPDGIPLSSVLQLLEGQRIRMVDQAREAEIALVDLARGSYGICQKCGQSIPPSRLDIKPATRMCVRCAR